MQTETIEKSQLFENGGEWVKCAHCGEITHIGGLIGMLYKESADDCPHCGHNAFTGE